MTKTHNKTLVQTFTTLRFVYAAQLGRSNVCFFNFSMFLKDRFWPVTPLAGLINKRYSGCVERQVHP